MTTLAATAPLPSALGEPTREFGVSIFRTIGTILGGLFMGAIGVGIYLFSKIDPGIGWWLFKAGLVLLFGGSGIACLVMAVANFGRRILICPGGFVEERLAGRRVFLWEEIAEVYESITQVYVNGIPTGTQYGYSIVRQDGVRTRFDNQIQLVEQLGPLVAGRVYSLLLPILDRQMAAGRIVKFGPLGVQRGGLVRNGKQLLWAEVESVELENGELLIKEPGKWMCWHRSRSGAIPNLHVFLSLVKSQIGGRCAA